MDFLYVETADNLRLQGAYYEPGAKDLCVLFIHGMSGNVIENYFADVLGHKLAKNGVGFLYGHNRGYNHINDIATSKLKDKGGYETKRFGATYEIFTDCLLDIDAWMEEVRRLGYRRVVLMGHSLGCNKTIYYFSQKKPDDVVGVILASPPDMIGLIKKPEYQSNSTELYMEATDNVEKGQPHKLLSSMIWDWYNLSSQTFLSLFSENTEVDNLPILRKPNDFPQLASINVPILGFMGEYDDIAIRTLEEDMDLIENRAIECPAFTKKYIPKASHTYDGVEENVSEIVLDWLQKTLEWVKS